MHYLTLVDFELKDFSWNIWFFKFQRGPWISETTEYEYRWSKNLDNFVIDSQQKTNAERSQRIKL